MQHPSLISICIFNYNYGRFLGAAVSSALAQTYADIEVVVCDNASTDDSMAVLQTFAHDPRLRVYRNDTNIGWMQNHKRAIAHAKGAYVIAIPADDCLLPNFCEAAYAHLRMHAATSDVVYASVAYTDAALTPQINGSCVGLLPGAYAGGRNEYRELLRMDHIRWPVMLAPRELLLRYADFDESLHAQADWAALLAMAADGVRFAYIPIVGALIRRHADQCSADGSFVGSTRELEDYLAIHERFVTRKNHWRFHGIEQTLMHDFRRLYESIAQRTEHGLSADVQSRAARYTETLQQLHASDAPQRPQGVPRVSVIVTSGGTNLPGLRRALRSLEIQEFQDFEIVVVQTGAESLEPWLTSLPLGSRTRYFRTMQSASDAAARNIGIRLSVGEFVTYMDETASFAATHLSSAVAIFEATGAAAVCANSSLSLDGRKLPVTLGIGRDMLGPEIGHMVPAQALIHRYSVIERVGYFAENLPVLDDWHFFLTLAAREEISASAEATVHIDYTSDLQANGFARAGLNTFAAVLDMIYQSTPVLGDREQRARNAYRAQVVQAWPHVGGNVESMRKFLGALSGSSLHVAET